MNYLIWWLTGVNLYSTNFFHASDGQVKGLDFIIAFFKQLYVFHANQPSRKLVTSSCEIRLDGETTKEPAIIHQKHQVFVVTLQTFEVTLITMCGYFIAQKLWRNDRTKAQMQRFFIYNRTMITVISSLFMTLHAFLCFLIAQCSQQNFNDMLLYPQCALRRIVQLLNVPLNCVEVFQLIMRNKEPFWSWVGLSYCVQCKTIEMTDFA